MAFNWTTYAGFRPAGCLPCCPAPPAPTACACALLIPEFGGVYADYATAVTAIADHVADCVGFSVNNNPDPGFPFSVDTSSPTDVMLNGSAKDLSGSTYFGPMVSMTMLAGNIDVTWTMTTVAGTGAQTVIARLYDCNWVQIGSQIVDTSGSFSITIPSDGTYYLFFLATLDTGSALTIRAAITLTPSTTFVLNPVIALWDDSGTTRSLYACPRLQIIPTMFSPFGSPLYASTGAANTDFSNYVSNCVGVITNNPAVHISFAATDAGTSLRLNGRVSTIAVNMLGSVNVLGGQTIDFAFTLAADLGTPSITINVVDNDGNVVATIGPTTSSPQSSSAMPYSGDYFITAQTLSDDPSAVDVSCDLLITSSGTLTVNPVAALVDSGTDCPFVYDC